MRSPTPLLTIFGLSTFSLSSFASADNANIANALNTLNTLNTINTLNTANTASTAGTLNTASTATTLPTPVPATTLHRLPSSKPLTSLVPLIPLASTITETVSPLPFPTHAPNPHPHPATPGSALILNNCPYPAYVFSVSPSGSSAPHTLGSYSETYQNNGGVSLKISTSSDSSVLYDGKTPLVQFQYDLDGGNVWYELANSNGVLFAGQRVVLEPSDGGCEGVVWEKGSGEETVLRCGSGGDLVLTLC
ncbi:MAG: hypothetical protein MMC23_002939 [Stictis urceolatum]|nr:hypothetical protein [Stictis urceolata]